MVTLAPRWVKELHIITGICFRAALICFRVPSPSTPGISTSSSTRSGRIESSANNADAPSLAVPATSSRESELITVRSSLRTTAESSTIRILAARCGDWVDAEDGGACVKGQASMKPSMASFSVSASSSKGFIRYSSAPASSERTMKSSSASVVTIMTLTSE